jgi:hypothetical protein
MANTKITSRVIADNSVGIDALNVTDGTNGQALVTDGSGTLSFSTIQGYTDSDVETYLDGGTSTPTFSTATVTGDLTVDTDTFYVDSTNNRVGIGIGDSAYLGAALHIQTSQPVIRLQDSDSSTGYTTIEAFDDGTLELATNHGDSTGDIKLTVNANNALLVESPSGRIGMPAIGQTSSWMGGQAKLGINSTSATGASLSIHRHYNGAFSGYLVFQKSRSTDITNLGVVSSGDYLGSIDFTGSDGNSYSQGAHIRAIVDGTPGDQDMPTKLTFGTTPDGSATPLDRLTIGASGQITLNSHVISDRADFFDSGIIAASGTYTSPSTQDAPGGMITITLASDPFAPTQPGAAGLQLINTYHHIPGRTGAYAPTTSTIASTNRGTPHGTIAFTGGGYTITNTSSSYPLYYKIRHMTG